MSDPMTLNQRIVLASRPVGAPTPENFRMERVALPDLEEGRCCSRPFTCRWIPTCAGA